MKRYACTFFLLIAACDAIAGSQQQIREYRQKNEHRILTEYLELLSIPNVASDTENIRKNAAHLQRMMEARGLQSQLLQPEDPKGPPAVYGEWKVPGAARTILLYSHYDGQPTDPADWTGSEPWKPVLRTDALYKDGKLIPAPAAGQPIDPQWRIYGRSASDDKAGAMAILTALDAIRASGLQPTSNLKVFLEGEEEAGSSHLAEILKKNSELLKSDAWIIIDGPVHQSGKKLVCYGVRGDTNVDITVYGPSRPLHSGHYGNWAPNPAMRMAQLLAGMKDRDGRVLIEGWYDGVVPLSEREQNAIREAPDYDAELMRDLQIALPEGGGKGLLEMINLPSLNVNGIRSADAGDNARNVIPTTAVATLDLRLVKGVDYRKQVDRLIQHIRKQGYYIVDRDPSPEERLQHPLIAKVIHKDGGYNAQRTSMDLPISMSVLKAVRTTTTDLVVALPTLGGSLPLSIIEEALGAPAITVPIANHDNNQHAENENLRIGNLWDGIETVASVMLME